MFLFFSDNASALICEKKGCPVGWHKNHQCTGKSFSEALILASTNPQYDMRLFIEFPPKYKFTTCCVQELFCFFLFWHSNSMNNLLSYYGITDSRMRAFEKDLPVSKCCPSHFRGRNVRRQRYRCCQCTMVRFDNFFVQEFDIDLAKNITPTQHFFVSTKLA